MNLRRDVRKAIQRGSSVYATVEEYKLGYATVRLAKNGARLTNLSTQGAIVTRGDQVIVDYSAGVKPVVRPLFIPAYEPETLEIDSGKEVTPPDDDFSCAVNVTYAYGHGLGPEGEDPFPYESWEQFIPISTWTKIQFADNQWKWGSETWGFSVEYYDSAPGAAGMYDETKDFGQNYIEIKRTGRYIITAKMEFDENGGNRTTGIPYYDLPYVYVGDTLYNPITGEKRTAYNNDGHFEMRIVKNDIPVAWGTYRTTENGDWTQGGLDGPYPILNAIVWCAYGDRIAIEVWENNNGPYYWPGWGYPASGNTDGNGISVVYIPGSERAVYEATGAQHAYIFADARNQPAYMLGAFEGGYDFRQHAYTRGGMEAGGQDQQWAPRQGSFITAYTEGYDISPLEQISSQSAYLSGN